MTDYASLVPEHWHEKLGWNGLSAELRTAIGIASRGMVDFESERGYAL